MKLVLVALLAGVLSLYLAKIAAWLIENLRGGGPRPPSHPLPGDDGLILRTIRLLRRVHASCAHYPYPASALRRIRQRLS
jgi:hypothetical protein